MKEIASSNRNKVRTVLITGAAGSLGSALAKTYAAPGITLLLHARKGEALAGLAAECAKKGAEVMTEAFDLRDHGRLAEWLDGLSSRLPLDLVIVNAGVNTNIGEHNEGEQWDKVRELIDVNIVATLATVHAVLPAMRRRGCGQIALISSLAAYFGLPITPSYSASKAAIKAYGEGLRAWLAPEGIRVNVVMPGYVESKMCREMPGPKPFLWTPDRAARVIRRGLARNSPRITFPFPLDLGTWFLAILPPSVSERLLRLFKYTG